MNRLLPVLALVLVAGCRGPKGSPDSSVKSFYSAVQAEDWEAMADTITSDSIKKLGSRQKAMAVFARDFSGWKSVDLTIDDYSTDADDKAATVRFTCIASQIVNYKTSEFDCSDTFRLVKEEDGKWHVTLPDRTSLRPM